METLNLNMNVKYKLIALFGKSGSGKNTIQNQIVSTFPEETQKIIPCTTRPKREGEVDNQDYHFISLEIFNKMQEAETFLETTCFNNWHYGTSIRSLNENKINVGVFNPKGIQNIFDNLLKNQIIILPIQIYTNDKIRLIRALKREQKPNCKEICRRFLADEEDFENINFPYLAYNNNEDIDEFNFKTYFDIKWFNNYFDNYKTRLKDKFT